MTYLHSGVLVTINFFFIQKSIKIYLKIVYL